MGTRRGAGALTARGLTCFLLIVSFLLSAACVQVARIAFDGASLERLFSRYADTAYSGVTADEYPALAEKMAAYFRGDADTPQTDVMKNGAPSAAYSEKELTHLSDVRRLLRAAGYARFAFLPALLLYALTALCLSRREKRRGLGRGERERGRHRAFFLAEGAVAALALGVAVWAAVNFDGLFITFHKLAFTNDLWLLNPYTDLLLQLMPTPLFIDCAGRLGAALLPVAVLLLGANAAVLWRMRRAKKTETDKNV